MIYPQEFPQVIEGINYIRKVFSDRLEVLIPDLKPVEYLKTKNGASNGKFLCRSCHNNLHHKN